MAEQNYPTITVPAEAMAHIRRRTRQLDSLRKQLNVLMDSLVEKVQAIPGEDQGG